MITDNSNFVAAYNQDVIEGRYVIQLSFDEADTDHVYLTSHAVTGLTGTVYEGVLKNVSGTSQNIQQGFNTIGNLEFEVVDKDDSITQLQNTKLNADKGLRGKLARLYLGEASLNWSDYSIRTTQKIREVSWYDGLYTFSANDIQREMRKDIFDVRKTTLELTAIARTSEIFVYDTTGFQGFRRLVSQQGLIEFGGINNVGLIKLPNGCIVRYVGTTANSFQNCVWGVFGTEHLIKTLEKPDNATAENAPEITEYVYLEMPAPMMIYALLTGAQYGLPGDDLPDRWHLGITPQFIRTSDFVNIGEDLWDVFDNDGGVAAVIRGQEKTDGKRYIAEQLAEMIGCYLPIYANGEIGLKRRTGVISTGAYAGEITEQNCVKFSRLRHKMDDVVNSIALKWHYDVEDKAYRRINGIIDSESIARHGQSEPKVLSFKTLHSSRHAYNNIKDQFDAYRDRYAGPPLVATATLLPGNNQYEVGDVLRVRLTNVKDYNGADTTLNANMEVQRARIKPINGLVEYELLGSSQKAGPATTDVDGGGTGVVITPPSNNFFTGAGTEINPGNFAGVTSSGGITRITSNITLTGGSDLTASVYYCDEDLQIDNGVTVTITQNVQLRVNGFFTVNGTIDGKGRGIAAAANVNNAYIPGAYGQAGFFAGVRRGGNNGTIVYVNNNPGQYPPFLTPNQYTFNTYLGPGAKESAANLSLSVTSTGDVIGIPTDLRGTPGIPGGPAADADGSIIAPSGQGGSGGAGFFVICRGMNNNGVIDTSGNSGTLGAVGQTSAYSMWLRSGAGSAGAPGAAYFVIERGYGFPVTSSATNKATQTNVNFPLAIYNVGGLSPNLVSLFAGQQYTTTVRAGAHIIPPSLSDIYGYTTTTWERGLFPFGNTDPNYQITSTVAWANENKYQAFHRVQFLTGYVGPSPDGENVFADPPSALILTEATNTPKSATGNLSTIEASVTPPADPNYSYSFIRYRLNLPGQPWTDVGPAAPEALQIVPSDGATYEFGAYAVSESGNMSEDGIFNTITVTDIDDPTERDNNLPMSTPIIGLIGGGTEFYGRDAHFEFTDNNTELEYFSYYQIDVYDGVTLLRSERSVDKLYSYTSEKNAEDGNHRTFTLKVIAVGLQGQTSAEAQLTVSNPPPLVLTGISVLPGYNVIYINADQPTDPDYKHTEVFLGTTSTFTVNTASRVAITTGFPVVVGSLPNGTQLEDDTEYFVVVASSDEFGPGTPSTSYAVTTFVLPSIDSLGAWAYVDQVDLDFIDQWVDDDSIESTKIKSLTAGRIATGTLAATINISSLGSIDVRESIQGINRVVMGPQDYGGKIAMFSYAVGGEPYFALYEDGSAAFTGSVTIQPNSVGYNNLNDSPSGRGVNIAHYQYSTFDAGQLPETYAPIGCTIEQETGFGYVALKCVKVTATQLDSRFNLAAPSFNYNISLEPGRKWILSFYVRCDVASQPCNMYLILDGYAYSDFVTGTTSATPNDWVRIQGEIDFTSRTETVAFLRFDNRSTSDVMWIDGVMLEEKIADTDTASAYVPPGLPRSLTDKLDGVEDNATQGATWDLDITNFPGDAALKNEFQQWLDVGGDGRPADDADVTGDQIAGRGGNVCNYKYSTFDGNSLPSTTNVRATVEQAVGVAFFGSRSIKITATAADAYVYLNSSSGANYNVILEPNRKWILSAYVRCEAASQLGDLYLRTSDGVHHLAEGPFTTDATPNTWKRVFGPINLTGNSSNAGIIRLGNDSVDKAMWFDAVMLEEQIGNITTPSAYILPVPPRPVTDKIDNVEDNATNGATWGDAGDITSFPGDAALLNTLQQWDWIIGSAKPENFATAGATWSSNIAGQPGDQQLLNANQDWDEVTGSGKPANNADVTADNTSGRGVNICNYQYSSFDGNSLPGMMTSNGSVSLDSSVAYFGSKSLKVTPSGSNCFVLMTDSFTTYNIPITPNSRWLLSAYVRCGTASQPGQLYLRGTDTQYSTAASFTTSSTPNQWTRVSGIVSMESNSANSCQFRIDNDSTNKVMWFDALMMEEPVGNVLTPSAYNLPALPRPVTDVIDTVERDATAGATWSSNITGQPGDSELRNDQQAWNDVQSKPAGATILRSAPVDGLNLTSTHMGYYQNGAYRTWMDDLGRLFLNNGASDNFLAWNGSTLVVRGDIVATSVTAGVLNGYTVNSFTINSGTITGTQFRTAASGRRVFISDSGHNLEVYDAASERIALISSTNLNSVIQAWGQSGNDECIYGYADIDAGSCYGVNGYSHSSHGVRGSSLNSYGVYAGGSGYGPFTGGHDVLVKKDVVYEKGDIFVNAGVVSKNGITDILLEVEISSFENQRSVYGALLQCSDLEIREKKKEGPDKNDERPAAMVNMDDAEYVEWKKTHKRGIVAAVGEGQINVCNENGDFEVGDFISTSNVKGKGQRYDGMDLRCVVAKAMEPVNWDDETENTKTIACIYMCG